MIIQTKNRIEEEEEEEEEKTNWNWFMKIVSIKINILSILKEEKTITFNDIAFWSIFILSW
jgi:hypothetical protein